MHDDIPQNRAIIYTLAFLNVTALLWLIWSVQP